MWKTLDIDQKKKLFLETDMFEAGIKRRAWDNIEEEDRIKIWIKCQTTEDKSKLLKEMTVHQ